jgi:two-component system, chemotaxis family, protein-glutamate methylesterase/glutaminase
MSANPHWHIVIGTSAGGVEALCKLLRLLPPDFPASILVAMHTSAHESQLPRILARNGNLRAVHADNGSAIEPGTVYVARPNHHLIVNESRLFSTSGPRRNGHRPSVNALFESAAREWGHRVIGVILSGALDDGALGLHRIKQEGGQALVQSPDEAMFTGMPQSALDNVDVDFCAPVSELARELERIVRSEAEHGELAAGGEVMPGEEVHTSGVPGDGGQNPNHVAGLVCPECGGVLQEEHIGDLVRFRCHVGHELSEAAMLNAQGEQVERALWTALRILEERSHLVERAAERARQRGNSQIVSHFESQNRDARAKADVLRAVLMGDRRQPGVTALQGDLNLATEHDVHETGSRNDD